MENRIIWKKPNYKNHYGKVTNKEIDEMCSEFGNYSHRTGDIIVERNQTGRLITFIVYRVEKVGELVDGLDTLSRKRAIEELKKLLKLKQAEKK